jgi:ketosteroid isomerase-like protein
MSQEIIEAFRREYAAMSRKDWGTVFSVAVPDFELKTPAGGLDDERARPRESSAFLERRAAHLWTMRGNKAIRLEIFPRRGDALEAAGLSE